VAELDRDVAVADADALELAVDELLAQQLLRRFDERQRREL
jgi:hypothetical protein